MDIRKSLYCYMSPESYSHNMYSSQKLGEAKLLQPSNNHVPGSLPSPPTLLIRRPNSSSRRSNLLILGQNIRHRSHRRDTMRINLPMALRIMLLDMFKLRRLPKRRNIPIQMPQPLVQRRVSRSYVTDVAFEMLDVDGVKADCGCVEADVCFCY